MEKFKTRIYRVTYTDPKGRLKTKNSAFIFDDGKILFLGKDDRIPKKKVLLVEEADFYYK